jgi:chaperonin GroEL (HSP60 family)
MIRLGLQSVTAGANPISINRGIDKTRRWLTDKLEELAKPINGSSDIKAVASISAGNNDEIGQMIADAIEKVGADGVLSIENGNGLDTVVEVEEGMEIDRGYISPQFVTNNEKLTVEFDGARVLVTDEKIESIKDLVPILEQVSQNGGDPLLIIAEDVSGEALATLVVNKIRGVLNVAAIKAPGFGERRKALLQDIAIVTGSTFLAKDLGMGAASATLDTLGYARKVTISSNTTTLIADSASREEIDIRVSQLKKELENSDSIYDTQKLSEEGIVPGGGAALVHLSLMVDEFKDTLTNPEEKLGAEIVQKALVAPCRLIANNAGVEGDVIVEKVLNSEWEMGYNAMNGEFVNMMEAGVIDPKKVTRSGLMNSCSIAGMVLTTQAVITDIPKRPVAAGPAAGGPAMDPNAMGNFSL